jgi:hypothetical protein
MPENKQEDRIDRRVKETKNGKRMCVLSIREHNTDVPDRTRGLRTSSAVMLVLVPSCGPPRILRAGKTSTLAGLSVRQ